MVPHSTMNNSRDHPVFRRLTRQQLVVRRHSLGFQALVLDPEHASARKSQCKHCGRRFNAVWRAYLCHLCGRWACEPCSSVMEREHEPQRIRFVRCCVSCVKMVNKLPDPELLASYLLVPYVTASSKTQLGLHLADALRTNKELRPAVLMLLNHLGRQIGTNTKVLDEIREQDWAATSALPIPAASPGTTTRTPSGRVRREKRRNVDSGAHPGSIEWVQFLVQQCFEVSLPELPLDACQVAESDGTRQYPVFYDEDTELPYAPAVPDKETREEHLARLNLLGRELAEHKEVQLICDLMAKEFDADVAMAVTIHGEAQNVVVLARNDLGAGADGANERIEDFCVHAIASRKPFMVRHALLDVRFRHFASVSGAKESSGPIRFFFGFPIVTADTKVAVGLLCIAGSKPVKSITTMQYTVVKKLAEVLSAIWTS